MKFDFYLTSYIKINSISVIDINVKNQMIKLLENNIEEYSHDLVVEKDSLDKTQKALTIKEKKKTSTLGYIKNHELSLQQKVLESYSLRIHVSEREIISIKY